MMRRIAVLLVLLLLALPFQGCWNYQEVDSLNFVAGVAIDEGYEGYKYHLTMDIADTSSAGKDKPVVTKLLESEGDTILDAIRNATRRIGLRLHWSNCQIIVISRAVATESILPVLDFFMRDNEPRLTMELFVSEEETAKKILEQKPASMSITSFEIDKMYEMTEEFQPITIYQLMYEDYNTLAGAGKSLTLAALKLQDNVDGKTAVLDGVALFKKDKLYGFLTAEDTHYLSYVLNMVKGGTLNVKAPTGNTIASLEVFGNKTTVTPTVENGTIKFQVHTETDAAINELDETADVMDKDKRDGFEAAAEGQLQDSISGVIRMVQDQYGLDIFGFGDTLHKSDPQTWYGVRENWESVFKNLQVDVTCKINIRNSASEKNPVQIGD